MEKNYGSVIVKKSEQPYFFEFSLNPDDFSKSAGNEISIKAVFGARFGAEYENSEGPVKVLIGEPFPRIENWYAGDLHYHTNYSRNAVEFGARLEQTKKVAKEIGLDFIAVTDHSFALREQEWPELIKFSNGNSDNSFALIPGEEVSTTGGVEKYRHFLAIGIENYIPGEEIESNGGTKVLSPAKLVENVNSQGGVGYVAHPFYKDVFRMWWKEEDYDLPFQGLQIWNYDTWKNDISELEKGLQKWEELLANNRKVFIGAGSDAHGDFQILGRARTYVYTKDFSQRGILEALGNGNSFITDGPVMAAWINGATFGQEALVGEFEKTKIKVQFASNLELGRVSEIEIWNQGEVEEVLRPNKYFEPDFTWEDEFLAEDTYYRFVARTENGYTAYTNPIWVKTFSKPRAKIEVKKEEKIVEKITKFVSPIIAMPSIVINFWPDPIHKKELKEIIEDYKTDEMRKIEKITSDSLKKMNSTSGQSVLGQKYTKSGQVSEREKESAEKDYTVERHGGKIYYPE